MYKYDHLHETKHSPCSDFVGLPASGAAVPSADVQQALGGLGDVTADGVAVLEAVAADAPA